MKASSALLALLLCTACESTGFRGAPADGGPAPAADGGGAAPDGGVRADGGTESDAGVNGMVSPGCPSGSIYGRACAPSGVLWLSDAVVSVDAPDCAGQPVHIEAVTDLNGFYRLDGVPAGDVTLHIRKGNFATSATINVPDSGVRDITGENQKICLSRNSARIGVLTGAFDRVETVLDQLGLTYTLYDGTDAPVPTGLQLLTDPDELAKYDIVLVNCGVNYWATQLHDPVTWQKIVTNLQNYVHAGGSLYISDWAFKLVEDPFPSAIDFNGDDSQASNVNSGYAPQTVTATVLDDGLAHFLGASTVPIVFPDDIEHQAVANNWAMMVGVDASTHVLLRGDPQQCLIIDSCYDPGPVIPNAPLLVSFHPYSTGKVIFTSFHFETVASETVLSLLRYLIFLL
jgi:hypothetical protein